MGKPRDPEELHALMDGGANAALNAIFRAEVEGPVPVQYQGAPYRVEAKFSYTGSFHVEFRYLDYTVSLPIELWRAQGRPASIFIEVPSLIRGT